MKISELLKKYREPILYLIFGVLTTVINWLVFYGLNLLLGEDLHLVSNVVAWIVSVAFAFFTNKPVVFKSRDWTPKVVLTEAGKFVTARLFSLGVEELGLFVLLDVLDLKSKTFFGVSGVMAVKIVLNVVVVILNYFFSKFLIFKKNGNKEDEQKENR